MAPRRRERGNHCDDGRYLTSRGDRWHRRGAWGARCSF